ncbi:MAG TPA: lipopolysaccharide biosynthesis protein [Marinobacter antarcticus]|uniref:Lipopolysaccharide biosynthesis protein n=3 Tax=root TaxID=1 RepID=A0A831R504_9GAMM|nr:lipopolysaccharide biosynthesis protein [Marinobacter antarcticus]
MQDQQMTSPNNHRTDYSDEISLVDLAAIFIRRRRAFYAVFVAITLAGLAYALLTPNEYQYVSLVQVAQKDGGTFVQPPTTAIATLENRWLPEAQSAYRAEHDKKMPFDVSFSNPEDTGLIQFNSSTTAENSKSVKAVHEALIAKVADSQGRLVKVEQASLESQIQSLGRTVDLLKGEKDAGEAIASAIENRSKLELQLVGLDDVELLVTSRQSAEKIAPKRSLIMALAVLLGLMIGVLVTFMSEFASSVRDRLASDGAQ